MKAEESPEWVGYEVEYPCPECGRELIYDLERQEFFCWDCQKTTTEMR